GLTLTILIIATLSFASCVTQKYKAPGMPINGQLYRSDSTTAPADTTSIATLPYRSLFADTILQGLIDEGLRENPDLKVAMERMTEAGENFKQSKVAGLP